ncbi:MAG: aldehyde dehydrogenase family protein, partial [Chloroflexota bacterium]
MNPRPTLPFVNPATGEQFGEVAMNTPAEVRQAVAEMRQAAVVWRQKPIQERVRIIRQLQKVLIDATDEVTAVLNRDCGKTRQDALVEFFITINLMDRYCRSAESWLRPRRVPSGIYYFKRCYVEQRPYGVVGIIGPWNYPVVLTGTPVIAALLAGNTVVLKPSEVTAATNVLIEQLLNRVPELQPYVRVVHGDGSVGAALVEAAPDLIFLTGSTPTGKKVMKAAADNLTPVICELGGKDPLIVLEDANVEEAARWGVWGACFNAGQTCMAVERVYVVEKVYDAFVEAAVREAQAFQMGCTADKESPYSMGPLTFERQVHIVDDHLQDALAKGAKVLLGGRRDQMFMQPTVLVDVDHSMKVMREESFGPFLPIMKVKDEAEAIRLANDCAFGLSAYVWSEDLTRAQRVASQINAGTLVVNDALSHFAVTQLPFGGVKHTGNGRVHGQQDLLQFTQSHSYAVGRTPSPLDIATHLRKPGHYWLGAGIMRVLFGVTPEQRLQGVQELANGVKERLPETPPSSAPATPSP